MPQGQREFAGLRKMGTYCETIGNLSVFQRKWHLLANYSFRNQRY